MSEQTTLRPWKIKAAKQGRLDTDESQDWGISAILGDKENIIAETFWRVDQHTFAPAEANARLIVLAVNSHDALVKALSDVIRFLERLETVGRLPRGMATLNKYRAALALAKGDTT